MKQRDRTDPVYFIAEYEDGSRGYFGVARDAVPSGDLAAMLLLRKSSERVVSKPGKSCERIEPSVGSLNHLAFSEVGRLSNFLYPSRLLEPDLGMRPASAAG
jgi:hypothetical protein